MLALRGNGATLKRGGGVHVGNVTLLVRLKDVVVSSYLNVSFLLFGLSAKYNRETRSDERQTQNKTKKYCVCPNPNTLFGAGCIF